MKAIFLPCGLLLLSMILALTGCAEEPKASPNKPGGNTPPNKAQGGGGISHPLQVGGGGLFGAYRMKDRVKIGNDLQQMVLFYQTFNAERGRSPNSEKEFTDYIKTAANQLYNEIAKEKYYGIVPDATLASATIVAYTKDPGPDGTYLVAHGDRSVDAVSAAVLKKVVKDLKTAKNP
jgi:hypothetical protein